MKAVFLILFTSVILTRVLVAQSQEANYDLKSLEIYSDNSSQDGIQGQAFVLMHNRKGIRIEYNIHKKKLELWISPLAGKSINYIDRNFSNRDDYTRIFDKISFPRLGYSQYLKTEYDPFHSVIHFTTNKLHILSLYDKSGVMVWFENEEIIDIKTDKQDRLIKNDDKNLIIQHPDRNKTFGYAAVIASGNGKFMHQQVYDPFRSFYSRATLVANQPIFIGGDDYLEKTPEVLASISKRTVSEIIADNEKKIADATNTGIIRVRKNNELQKIIDLNKKIILSMQDESGGQRAALRYIYYLIWHRDGGMTSSYDAYTGWVWPLDKWTAFEFANPTVEKKDDKTERYFGQLVNGKITKKEEDGPFYGIWSAFSYWTQTGDTKFRDEKSLKVMEDNISWLENNFFDISKGLFGRYHYCESPFYKSEGDGWDAAVGSASSTNYSMWKGDTIVKAYDLYMNNIVYGSYLMLSAMEKEPKATEYLQKATALGGKLMPYFAKSDALPNYGELITTQSKSIDAEAFGMDETDYIWGLTLPHFYPDYQQLKKIREGLYERQMKKPKGYFFAGWFSNITAMDPELHNEQKMIKAIEYVLPQCIKPGKCLPMAYTIPEIVDVDDCDVYHDVRPTAFSVASMFASISNLGVRRLPFGIAARGTSYLDQIENYVYKSSLIDFSYVGTGSKIKELKVNGKTLAGTYQLPEKLLKKGDNKIEIITSAQANKKPVLFASTVSLENISGKNYYVQAFGKNVLMFKNIGDRVVVKDATGKLVESIIKKSDDEVTYVEFTGTGLFTVII